MSSSKRFRPEHINLANSWIERYGFESFTLDQKCITVFGSARFKEDHPYYQLARDLGRELADAGYAVMTGGGFGVNVRLGCYLWFYIIYFNV
jgi:hypothetical protein